MAFQTTITTGFLKTKDFSIDEESIIFDDTQMMCSEVTGFAYGYTVTRVSGIKANTTYSFQFLDSSGDKITFNYVNALLGSPNDEDAYSRIIEEIWKCFGTRLLHEMISTISRGISVTVAGVTFSNYGITTTYKPFFGSNRDILTKWDEVTHKIDNGNLIIGSKVDKDVWAAFEFQFNINAHLISEILNKNANETTIRDIITGKKKI